MRTLLVAVLLFSLPAAAKDWLGITPGATLAAEVLKKLGEPTKTVAKEAKESTLSYKGDKAPKGAVEANFQVDAKGVVKEIVVFPAPKLDQGIIEETYGAACGNAPVKVEPCYTKGLTDDFRVFFRYKKSGVVVFFNDDGKVYSFVFRAGE